MHTNGPLLIDSSGSAPQAAVERMKDAFLSRVSHEFRTPITVLRLSLECLDQAVTSEQRRKIHGVIRSRLNRWQEMLEDLILLAELRGASQVVCGTTVRLSNVVGRALRLLQSSLEGIDLRIRMAPGAKGEIWNADERFIETAFRHLFLNAIRFNKPNGKIDILLEEGGGKIRVSFTDTGSGIRRDILPYICGSFYQGADPMTRKVGGLGLGLSIVSAVMDLHGGTVHVQSKEGVGSRFSVTFPRERPRSV